MFALSYPLSRLGWGGKKRKRERARTTPRGNSVGWLQLRFSSHMYLLILSYNSNTFLLLPSIDVNINCYFMLNWQHQNKANENALRSVHETIANPWGNFATTAIESSICTLEVIRKNIEMLPRFLKQTTACDNICKVYRRAIGNFNFKFELLCIPLYRSMLKEKGIYHMVW